MEGTTKKCQCGNPDCKCNEPCTSKEECQKWKCCGCKPCKCEAGSKCCTEKTCSPKTEAKCECGDCKCPTGSNCCKTGTCGQSDCCSKDQSCCEK